ncbi:predicted protein [Nematostella vectensis]|uniref:Selenoprotein O n=1 Tax=Nematostella vectensis TaxID=45351 RepID=A7SUK9_NEMVE|nr:predicted protein [Nematostella vectensis]|eukprot:XP_001624724.1 predicted protein [Nematostella vectensis]
MELITVVNLKIVILILIYRHGDGRAVFRSSVREFLASEAMHYLGVPTSQVASLVVSDEQVWRDQFYDGHPIREKAAVVLRLAKSWFRIGSLEILTSNGETDLLRKVVDFVIEQHFNKIKDSKEKYLEFFSQVVTRTAHMIAIWQALGFAHGVCNTDNFSLLSMTIDYGPFGFMDTYNSDFVPNTSDDEGRYSFSNQPSAGQYNLAKLLDALSPIIDLARALYKRMVSRKLFVNSSSQGFDLVRADKKNLFMDENPFSEYLIMQKPCDLAAGL